ncbi:serine/threonine-protein kinase [Tautonia marina]|uniref:serine/threonine-protein kinase n=1 Tax=Tautonia marina TaxID=2653855 RepID=UPI001375F018|nr:serine/threonine-protein kinase [Tautonia marina]
MGDEPEAFRTATAHSVFNRVEALCQAFTEEWEAGKPPSIEPYLVQVDEETGTTLLTNLLDLELRRRRGLGERPTIDEYIERFPRHASLIRRVFLESTSSASSPGDRTETAGNSTSGLATPVVSRLGEYRLIRELGRGGMGVVFEAVHVRSGDRVALKTLPLAEGSALHRFKREFRSAAELNHPHLVGLHELAADGVQWFFTMDLVDGTDFLRHVRPRGRLDEGRLRAALTQLASAVMALHGVGLVHRDLKPSNVLVSPGRGVVVLDFGLVQDLGGASASGSDRMAGTPAYMAPEQAAGKESAAPSADWYAVGVMLYEALSGRRPFDGTLLQVLQGKQSKDAPPLPVDGSVPEDLPVLAMRLLARDPAGRPDALEVARVVSAGAMIPGSDARGEPGVRLVGRGPQLAQLEEARRDIDRSGSPLTVFIRGRSGEGKTTLAEQFLAPLREDRQLTILSGRCYDRESVPFKALDNLIDALASHLRGLPPEDAALLMPADVGLLADVFPVLGRVDVVGKARRNRLADLDPQQMRRRAFAALRELMLRLSDRAPVVMFVDDLQWGDDDSAEALFEILRPPEAPAVLFLGTYRSDEAEGSAFLNAWAQLQRKHDIEVARRDVTVGPLDEQQRVELLTDLIGRDDEVVRRRAAEIARETGGNPFLLVELAGCFDPDSDSFRLMPVGEVIAQKLGRLPTEARGLLEVIAVSGQALPVDEALQASGGHSALSLNPMRNERLVRLLGAGEASKLDTYHDKIRESVLDELGADDRRAIHGRLADLIAAKVGADLGRLETLASGPDPVATEAATAIDRIYDLAFHFDAAGRGREALACALIGAEQARRRFAPEVAAAQYEIARRNAGEAPDVVRFRIAEGYGEALMLLGRYDEANDTLDGVIDLVDDPERKARVESLQAAIAFKEGLIDRSIALGESGLRRLGIRVPRTRPGWVFAALHQVLIQTWHTLWPSRLHRRSTTSRRDLTIRLGYLISEPYFFQNSIKALWVHLLGMNQAEQVAPSSHLALTYGMHSCWSAVMGWNVRGARYGDRAMALARELNDLYAQGYSCGYQGAGFYAAARYEEGLEQLNEAIELLNRSGDLWEYHLARFHKACCHYGLGQLTEAVAAARETFASSARFGDTRTYCSSWLWARATGGDLPFEEIRGCYPIRPDDILSTVHGLLTEAEWLVSQGRTGDALQVFERAAEMVRTTFCVNGHSILVIPMLARGLRLHAEAIAGEDARQAAQLRRRSARLARWATRFCWLFPATYSLALRERSLSLAALGQTRKALHFAERSCAFAESKNARYEFAQSALVRAQIARHLGRPGAEEQVHEAQAALEEIERPVRSTVSPVASAE